MMKTVPETHRDLLEQAVVVTIATVAADGQPFTAAVWRRWDGEFVRIVTDPKSRKYRNIQANAKVSILAQNAGAERYLALNGVVESTITARAEMFAELDVLTKMYTGKDHYYGDVEPIENQATASFVVLMIRPERFYKFG